VLGLQLGVPSGLVDQWCLGDLLGGELCGVRGGGAEACSSWGGDGVTCWVGREDGGAAGVSHGVCMGFGLLDPCMGRFACCLVFGLPAADCAMNMYVGGVQCVGLGPSLSSWCVVCGMLLPALLTSCALAFQFSRVSLQGVVWQWASVSGVMALGFGVAMGV